MPFPTYAKKEDIPAGFESAYAEHDGQWVPTIPSREDVDKLTKTVQKLRDAEAEAKKRAADAEEAAADARRKAEAKDVGGADDLLKKWQADTDAKLQPERDARAKAEARLRELLLDQRAKDAALKAGVLPKHVDALMKLNRDRLDLSPEERIVVKDGEGKLSTLTVDEFWAGEAKQAFDWAYAAPPASGSGATAATGAPSVGGQYVPGYTKEQFQALPPNARMDLIQKHGDPAAKKAAA